MSRANNFVERMQAGRDAAAHARHRGRATGGKARLHAAPVIVEGWEFHRQNERCKWEGRRVDIVEDFRRLVFPERYEDLS